MKNSEETKRVFILALSGIGNFLMQTPVFRVIKKAHPDWHITVWVAPRGTKALAENNPYIDEVLEAPIRNSLIGHWRLIQKLATQKYDSGLMLSPGQLVKGAAYLWLAGIGERIGHRYPLGNTEKSSFLLTDSISEEKNVHDIEQNLNLVRLLGVVPDPTDANYDFAVPPSAREAADTLLREHGVPNDRPLVGIHAGSAPGFEFKRWPLERFAVVATQLSKSHNAHILIFGGSDEMELKQRLKALLGPQATVITTSLLNTAACMQRCSFFLSNDSGLMHLAAAAGIPVYALFGPTNEQETGPRGKNSRVIRAAGSAPSYFTEAGGTPSNEALLALTTDTVLRALPHS